MEFQEIQRGIEGKPYGHVPNDSGSKNEQWFLGFDEKDGDVFLKHVTVVVKDISKQHEGVEFGFRIKEELL